MHGEMGETQDRVCECIFNPQPRQYDKMSR